MSKSSESNKPFKIDPRVAAVNRRGAASRKVSKKVSEAIDKFVKRLRKKHAGHDEVIRRHLEGASHRIHAEAEAEKLKEREAAKKAREET